MNRVYRTLSLLPACTEIVWALDLQKALVGRSHACDFPPGVVSLPDCTRPRIDTAKASAPMDRDIQTLLREGLSLFEVDVAMMVRLAPNLILTQSMCEVCAVSVDRLREALGEVLPHEVKMLSFSPCTLEEVWQGILAVASAHEAEPCGRDLVASCQQRMEAVAAMACGASRSHRPSVACVEWMDPLMAAGNWVPELVDMAGGLNLFGETGRHSPWLSWEAICEHDPEVVILMPCGFDLKRCEKESGVLRKLPGWERLRAVREDRVYLTDGNAFFNRPGPRLVESLEIVAEMLHPDHCHFGWDGKGWKRMERR